MMVQSYVLGASAMSNPPANTPEGFDPYYKWLGIRPVERPITHYRLLGLSPFEDDPDVIVDAGDRQMAHVRTHQTGKYSDLSQRLLNELSSARLCLLNQAKKAAYDDALRAAEAAVAARYTETPIPPPAALPPPRPVRVAPAVTPALMTSEERPQQDKAALPMQMAVLGGAAGGALLVVLLLVVLFWPAGSKPNDGAPPIASNSDGPPKRVPAPIAPALPAEVIPKTALPENPIAPPTPEVLPPAPVESPVPPRIPVPDPPTVIVPPKPELPKPTPVPPPDNPLPVTPEPLKPAPGPAEVVETPVIVPAKKTFAEKLPIPDAATLTATRKTVKELFAAEYKGKKPEEKLALARKLAKESLEQRNDPVGRYVLLDEALQAAGDGGDAVLAWKAADALDRDYRVDVIALKKAALADASRLALSPPRKITDMYLALIDQAVQQDDFDAGAALATAGLAVSRKAKDEKTTARLMARGKEMREFRDDFPKVKAARDQLVVAPDDAEAALVVGKYLCLVQGRWEAGLPLLAKCSDESYRKLAKLEVSLSLDVDELVTLADGWWSLSEKDRTPYRSALQRRGAHRYLLAAPFIWGLDRSRMEKRIAESPILSSVDSITSEIPQDVNRPIETSGTRAIPADDLAKERAATEMVFRVGGRVSIYDGRGNARPIDKASDLPAAFRLYSVSISSPLNDADMASLAGLRHLQSISLLDAIQVSEAGLHVLSTLTGVHQATVLNSNLTDESIGHFRRMKRLRHLNVSSDRLRDGLSDFVSLTQLQSLEVRGRFVQTSALHRLVEIKTLTRLGLHGDELMCDWRSLIHSSIAELLLGGTYIGNETVASIAQYRPRLESLELVAARLTNEGLPHLSKLPELTHLSITLIPIQGDLGPTSLITDEGLLVLKQLPKLQSLSLSNLRVFTGKSLSGLSDQKMLRRLQVSNCPMFSDPSMGYVKSQPNLQHLALSQVRISDAGIAHLKGLPLTSLSIDNIPLTDACLPAIESLEELRSLTVEKTEITPEALEALQKKLQERNPNR